MTRRIGMLACATILAAFVPMMQAQKREPTEKPGPQKSGFYDFYNAGSEFGVGIGITNLLTCTIGAATQPAVFAGNSPRGLRR